MRHSLIRNRYGPIVVTERESEWIVKVPRMAPEVFTSNFPKGCLSDAQEISAEEVSSVLAEIPELSPPPPSLQLAASPGQPARACESRV